VLNFPYAWFVWGIIGALCQSVPSLQNHNSGGSKKHYALYIKTRTYAVLGILSGDFGGGKVKCIPRDIFNYLDEVAFAHWLPRADR